MIDLEGDPVLLLECPYCSAECKVDTAPFKQRVIPVMRGRETGPESGRYGLPDKVPTFKPGDDQPGPEA